MGATITVNMLYGVAATDTRDLDTGELLALALDAIPQAAALVAGDLRWTIGAVNDAFCHLVKYDRDALVGTSMLDLLETSATEVLARVIDAAGVVIDEEVSVSRRGMRGARLRMHGRALGSAGGWRVLTFDGGLLPVRGIDPGTSETAWARAVIGGVSDIVVHIDDDLQIRWVSPSFTKNLGYDEHELVGTIAVELLHADDVDAAAVELAGADEGHWASNSSVYRVRHQDGSWRFFELSASVQPVDSPLQGILVAGIDVTARTEAEQQLRRSEQWAQALVQGSSDAVLVVSADGVVTYASPAVSAVFGYRSDEMVDERLFTIVHPDDQDEARQVFHARGEGAVAGAHQFRIRHRDDSWRVVDVVFTDLLQHPAVRGVLLNVRDVTNRLEVEEMLAEQADLLDAIARGAPLGITLQRITQMVEHVIGGSHCAIGVVEDDGAIRCHAAPNLAPAVVSFLDELSPASTEGQRLRSSRSAVLTYDLRDGRDRPVGRMFAAQGYRMCRVAAVLAPGSGELLGSVEVFTDSARDLTPIENDLLRRAINLCAIAIERRHLETKVERQALYDPLTGLPNRTLLKLRADEALVRTRRLGGGVALLFIDLDRFKVINDSVGHEFGDQFLVEVARRFEATLRPGDTLARFGGDEFMVVCSRVPDEAQALTIAERLMRELQAPFAFGDGDIFVTASIGIAFSDEPASTAESMISAADVAMYRAKDQGRNQCVVFEKGRDQRAVEALAVEQAIRIGIEQREFELYFQPVVRLVDGAMTHVEALVRWHRPGHGMVFPDVFIPIAEDTGLIVPLGWLILEDACREAVAWPELPNGEKVEIAVNLSARQLASPELIPTVTRVLAESGLDPGRLCFEVTESALVRDVEQAIEALNAIKALGVHLAIDDFGTGYASLEYVRHFTMADYLKIDRAFVEGVDRPGSHEAAIVTAAIALARSVGLTVIAEGVETVAQMEALQALDCELAQGYLFSRPVPLEAAIAVLGAPPPDRTAGAPAVIEAIEVVR